MAKRRQHIHNVRLPSCACKRDAALGERPGGRFDPSVRKGSKARCRAGGAPWRAIRIELSQGLPHGLPQGLPLGRPLRLPLGLPQGLPQGLDFCTHKSIDSHAVCAPVKLLKSLFLHTPNRWIHMLLGCAFEGHGWLLFVQPDRWIHMLFASSGSAFKRLHYAGRY